MSYSRHVMLTQARRGDRGRHGVRPRERVGVRRSQRQVRGEGGGGVSAHGRAGLSATVLTGLG